MTSSYFRPESPPAHTGFQLAALLLLFSLVFEANAHSLAVDPTMPNGGDSVAILVTGDWPGGSGPSIKQWNRSDTFIRIDAYGVLPGIPQPILPYKRQVDIGTLPPGLYHVEYFIEVLAAPGQPTLSKAGLAPVASLDFEVLAIPTPIPALSVNAIILLIALLLTLARRKIGIGYKKQWIHK